MDVFRLFGGATEPKEILEYLDESAYDSLYELDLEGNRLRTLAHTQTHYRTIPEDGPLMDLRSYAANFIVFEEDREIFLSLNDPAKVEEHMAASTYPGIISAQYRVRALGGDGTHWIEQVLVCGEKFGLPKGVVRSYQFDIQLQKNRRLSLAFSAQGKRRRDRLTGLMVGDSFYVAARNMLSVPLESGEWSMLFITVEHMKLFREWFGPERCDDLLSRIGEVLRREASETSGLAGHLWDDDFLLLTPYDPERIEALYDRLHAEIKAYGIPVGFLPLIGVCLERDAGSVLSMADRAAIAASLLQGNFRTRIGLYLPEMGNRTKEEYRILSDFQHAMRDDEIYFVVQPQCLLDTRQLVGAEALVRWKKSDGTMVPPSDFIPTLEKYGFISEMDQYVWRQVCKWLRSLLDRGVRPVPVSINVSQTDLLTFDVPAFLDGLVREYAIPAGLLKLEITESIYASDVPFMQKTLVQLRENGFPLLMDDFGSGYSSLNMLHAMGVDIVKMDAHFLDLDKNDINGMKILESVINMTKRLGLPIIVEGAENESHVQFLRELGVRYVQGYYYYRPLPAEQMEALILDENNVSREGVRFNANMAFGVREFLDKNIYSDAMLNMIIGAAAYYTWDGKESVLISRYNEQFRQAVADERFDERILDVLPCICEPDRAAFLDLFRQAEADQLNGAGGVVGVYRSTGELGRFQLRIYYMGERPDGRKDYFGSMRELTELKTLQEELRLISRMRPETVVFAYERRDGMHYRVSLHGLRERLGLDWLTLQDELNRGVFPDRALPEERQALRELMSHAGQERRSAPVTLAAADGQPVSLTAESMPLRDSTDIVGLVRFRLNGE